MEEEPKKSPTKLLFSLIFILIAVSLLIIYWLVPFNNISFSPDPENYNFNKNNLSLENMQFSYNMRYPNKEISYKIENCGLQKTQDMKNAFEILETSTILDFYPVNLNQEISITCEEKNNIQNNLFIAGEGGPTNITLTDKFSVILNGKVLLIKKSQCTNPNIAIHELLHALGFAHSDNSKNIMYNYSKCSQEIGSDIINKINHLYETPVQEDLNIEDASAAIKLNILEINISIRNEGLKKSNPSNLKIYSKEKLIKEIEIPELEIGHGTKIMLSHLPLRQKNVEELKLLIEYDYEELDKSNNEIILKIKK